MVGQSPIFLGYGCKKKKKGGFVFKRQKYLKDGFGDLHSQTSLYSLDEEISLCPKRTWRGTLKRVEKGTMFFFKSIQLINNIL